MAKYIVTYRMTRYETAEIEADSADEAQQLAVDNPDDYDWGEFGENEWEIDDVEAI